MIRDEENISVSRHHCYDLYGRELLALSGGSETDGIRIDETGDTSSDDNRVKGEHYSVWHDDWNE